MATRRGKLTLALLCAVAFLDFIDAPIVNVALPSIRHDLHFPVQGLQWVLSGYLLTYGGFMLLGGRAGDLLGRRRILVAGTALFGASSLTGGFAGSTGILAGARLAHLLARPDRPLGNSRNLYACRQPSKGRCAGRRIRDEGWKPVPRQ